jgi:hypothetical protein
MVSNAQTLKLTVTSVGDEEKSFITMTRGQQRFEAAARFDETFSRPKVRWFGSTPEQSLSLQGQGEPQRCHSPRW